MLLCMSVSWCVGEYFEIPLRSHSAPTVGLGAEWYKGRQVRQQSSVLVWQNYHDVHSHTLHAVHYQKLQPRLCMNVISSTGLGNLTSTKSRAQSLVIIMITDFEDDDASLCIIITIQHHCNVFAAESRACSQPASSQARRLHWIPGGAPS